jgi:hypothetical protein
MSTSKDLKYTGVAAAGAWATGGTINTARWIFGRCWNSNSRFSFWWYYLQLLQEQQKNIMVQLGHSGGNPMITARI